MLLLFLILSLQFLKKTDRQRIKQPNKQNISPKTLPPLSVSLPSTGGSFCFSSNFISDFFPTKNKKHPPTSSIHPAPLTERPRAEKKAWRDGLCNSHYDYSQAGRSRAELYRRRCQCRARCRSRRADTLRGCFPNFLMISLILARLVLEMVKSHWVAPMS